MFPVTQIDTFYNGLTLRHRDTINTAAGGTFMKWRPEECYDHIEIITAHHNDWDTSAQLSESSSSITSSSDTEIAALKAEMAEINKNLMRVLQVNQQVKAITPNCKTCGGPHFFSDCPATTGNTQNVYAAGAYQAYLAPSYQAPVYQALVPQPQIPQPQVVTTNEFTNFMKANDFILKNMQTNMTSLTNSNLELKNMFGQFMKMNTSLSLGSGTLPGNTITNPKKDLKVSAPRPNLRPSIPYPSRLQDQKLCDKADDQREKFFQIFKDLNFNISFANALILIPKFGPSIKSLLTNNDKLCELARTLLNEHYSAVLLKKLPKTLEDPGKFLIPCDFPGMAECLALADLGASINLMPLSVWNKLSLPDLLPTCMTLELTDQYFQEVLGFSDVIVSGNPTPYYDLISKTSPTLTSFGNSDFLLEEVDAFLAIEYDPTSPEVHQSYDDTEEDILLLEAFLNDDPSLPPLNQGNYLPEVHLSVEEKTALITVLKSHKRAIAWKLSDIKVVENEENELILTRLVMGWSVCIDYRKLNEASRKDHFPLPFMDQMLERLAGNQYYCFLDGFSGYFQIPIDPKDQEKTTFTCPYGTFAYRRMPFGADDPSSRKRYPISFSKECVEAFQTLKRKLTESPILIAPDWDMPFELMCDASDFAIGAVLGQRQEKHFRSIHYASKIMIEAESNYTTTEKEMLAVVYAFKKFRSYLIINKSIVYTDHSTLKYLFAKKDSKARLLRWVLLL
nr:reverse transcriptase domain-containing protein [Tanacetum cinerariifolium]